MNITEQLFKIFNTAKYESAKWDKELEKESSEGMVSSMTGYYAAYYGGARDLGKIMLKTFNGELTETELQELLYTLHNPDNLERVN